MAVLEHLKPEFNSVVENLKKELTGIRTGRANPSLIENVVVESYGTRMPVSQMASIGVQDAKTLVVDPWDKNAIKDIEKALAGANLGITPVNDGKVLRIPIPAMTEETRKSLVKSVNEKVEQHKISIKVARDKIKADILRQEKAGDITEDDKYLMIKELDEMASSHVDMLKALGENKEKEIMTV